MSNRSLINFVFINASTVITNGNELSVNSGMSTLNVEITGTGTGTIIFEGKSVDDGSYYPIQCVNLSDMTLSSSTTSIGSLYQCDLTGLCKFRTRLSAVAIGNISVKGRCVD